VFCRTRCSVAHPGDTSWAVKPQNRPTTAGWDGLVSAFYRGGAVSNDTSDEWGGGFAGFRADGEHKPALTGATALSLWGPLDGSSLAFW
jgi:hypothetical protein